MKKQKSLIALLICLAFCLISMFGTWSMLTCNGTVALDQAGNNHRRDGVAGRVNAGRHGVNKEPDGCDDGECLAGETEQADNQHFAYQTAAGCTGQHKGTQDSDGN